MVGNPMEDIDKIRDQFNAQPYYNAPLAATPKVDYPALYIHNMVTAFYRRDQKVIDPAGKVILDAGCGSGYKSLTLAEANPGAKIVGIDLSEKSVEIARERLKLHGFREAEFCVMTIEEIGTLNYEFDYINCDDVLYLVPDVLQGLRSFQSVLKKEGIIRANLHSKLGRQSMFRMQEIWKRLGLMEGNPEKEESELVKGTMRNLKDKVFSKQICWGDRYENSDQLMFSNHLLLGDKGFTIPEVFALLRESGLEFVSMVKWKEWDLLNLFQNIDELPIDILFKFSEMSIEEQFHIYELFHPGSRLIDFWCGHAQEDSQIVRVEDWTEEHWHQARVHLHPQVRTEAFKQGAIASITQMSALPLYEYLSIDPEITPLVDSVVVSFLFPLIDAPWSFRDLVGRSQKLYPIDPVSGEEIGLSQATQKVKDLLIPLYEMGYILLES